MMLLIFYRDGAHRLGSGSILMVLTQAPAGATFGYLP